MMRLRGSIKSYIIGFLLSIILTLVAYNLVTVNNSSWHHSVAGLIMIGIILILASVQLLVQLIFFIHLREESAPRWHLAIFIATFSAVFVIIVGSIWIMYHLNYNMTPKQMNQYINDQSGF